MYIDLKQRIAFFYSTFKFKEKIINGIINSNPILKKYEDNSFVSFKLFDGSKINIYPIEEIAKTYGMIRGEKFTLIFIEKNELDKLGKDINYIYVNSLNGLIYVVNDDDNITMDFLCLETLSDFLKTNKEIL